MTHVTTQSQNARWGSVQFLANHYGVSVPTIWRWSKKGTLPKPTKISAGCSRWDLTKIESFDDSRGTSL